MYLCVRHQWFHLFIKLKVHLYKIFLQLPKVSLTFSYSILLAYKHILLHLKKKKIQFNRYNEGFEGIRTLNISVGNIRIYQLSYKTHNYCNHICPKIIFVLYEWSWLFWVIFGNVTRLNDSLEELNDFWQGYQNNMIKHLRLKWKIIFGQNYKTKMIKFKLEGAK